MKKICFLLCLCMGVAQLYGQKEFREIRSAIKAKNNLDKAASKVSELEKKETFKNNPKLYKLGIGVQKTINDVENEKIYLKQKYDTVRFFSSVYGFYNYLLRCDSVEYITAIQKRRRPKRKSLYAESPKNNEKNLFNGGKFYLLKNDLKSANRFFSLYLRVSDTLRLHGRNVRTQHQLREQAAYWVLYTRFCIGDYAGALEYKDLALQDSARKVSAMEYLAKTYQQLKDTTAMLNAWEDGVREYTDTLYFFTSLMDYYNETKQYGRALILADSILKISHKTIFVKYAKSIVFQKLERHEDCILLSKEIIASDSLFADAYYNVGLSYCNMALNKEKELSPQMGIKRFRAKKTEIETDLRHALPYMEKFRTMRPEAKEKWAPLLYRIYLGLNMGKKFDEIDKILKDD